MAENPYESPAQYEIEGEKPRFRLLRGLICAVAFGCVGFCIPFLVLPLVGYEASELWRNASPSAILLSVIFASSAFANFTPTRGLGMVRSLLVTLCLLFVTSIPMYFVLAMVDPEAVNTRRGYHPPPSLIGPIIFWAAILIETGVFTHWQVRRASRTIDACGADTGQPQRLSPADYHRTGD